VDGSHHAFAPLCHCAPSVTVSLSLCHCVTVSLYNMCRRTWTATGLIDYQEWVAATMHLHRVNNEKNLRIAFNHFDSDNSGFIDIEELADALGADLQVLKEILAEVDTNNVSGLYCALLALYCAGQDSTKRCKTVQKKYKIVQYTNQ